MSEQLGRTSDATEPQHAVEDATSEQPKLRRRPFGYRKGDVREAIERREAELEARSAELDARDAEVGELRQDVAALWLAFAQHDRMIRSAFGEDAGATPERARPEAPAEAGAGPASSEPTPAEEGPPPSIAPLPTTSGDLAIGRQLSDLDEVLAAIELATQTLERTYVEETDVPPSQARDGGDPPEASPSGEES